MPKLENLEMAVSAIYVVYLIIAAIPVSVGEVEREP